MLIAALSIKGGGGADVQVTHVHANMHSYKHI